jgi:two-component system cell cycle sensor histidine kinase/response regulator CckA
MIKKDIKISPVKTGDPEVALDEHSPVSLIDRQEKSIPLNLLIVEDSVNDAELLAAELVKAGFRPQWKRVETETDFCASLQDQWDIICSDFTLPNFSTYRALELLQESKLPIPFIIISGTIGEERAVESLKAGATDYVLKDRLHRVGPVVKRALREVKERTERQQFEKQFIEAQKMEVFGQLAAGVAHDFNNILSVIIGYDELLIQKLGADSSVHEFTQEIRHAADRAVALTRQLLVFSRKQTMQLVVLDLNEVVTDMDKMLRRLIDENIELKIVTGEKLGRVQADAGYVGQVVMNLVVNARDAMPNGGKLTVATSNVMLDEKDVSPQAGAAAGEYVMLSVTDTGMGMTEEVKARLFEAFFTTKPKGTGLGLATCESIIKQCGGHIGVESALGKNTTFKIYFPRVRQPLDISTAFIKKGPLPRGTETLLLVEDEPSVRHLAGSVLEAQGYTVLQANNGQEGLRTARGHKGDRISLVVTDVIMPQMSGKVMSEWLKTTYPDIKILFTSGYTDDAIAHYGVLDIGVAFLPKPYTPAILAGKVREMLDNEIPGVEK